MSNAFLADRVRAKERMRAFTATTHLIEDEQIENAAWMVLFGIIVTAVLLAVVQS
jgi:hypothetical protein